MRHWAKRIFLPLRASRAGLFTDLSAGDTGPLRIPGTQLPMRKSVIKELGHFVILQVFGGFSEWLSTGLRLPPLISQEETAPSRQSRPKNPLAPLY